MTSPAEPQTVHDARVDAPVEPPRRSTWTLKQNLVRVVWSSLGRALWTVLPPLRPGVLRMFGGRVGRRCRFGSGVEIVIPWNIAIGDDVDVGDRVLLYALGEITIGDGVVIDFGAHLCAGTHDMTDPGFALVTPPIHIGSRCYIGLDAYVGPGVTLGPNCRVWPRASVYKSAPPGAVLRGNPAREISAPEPGEQS